MDPYKRVRDNIPENEINRQYELRVDSDKSVTGLLRKAGLTRRPRAGHDLTNPAHATMMGSKVYDNRVMYVSQDEMSRWQLPLVRRDYCAHKYIEYMKCVRDSYTCPWSCTKTFHDFNHCVTQEAAEREYTAERYREKATKK